MKKLQVIVAISILGFFLSSCRKEGCTDSNSPNYNPKAKIDDGSCICSTNSGSTPYILDVPPALKIYLPEPIIPIDNPMTVEGVNLGKKLFFDKILSADLSQSCSSCHMPSNAFDDSNRFSIGINGIAGTRNAMPLFNLAWNNTGKFFWDGRAISLEEQALAPVTNPIEMNDTWVNVMSKLQSHSEYPSLFNKAFGTSIIDSNMVAKALAQYERTLMSGNSKMDKFLLRQVNLSASEARGLALFRKDPTFDPISGAVLSGGGACDHCHGDPTNPLWTSFAFENNGLDNTHVDIGLAETTGRSSDIGKFKSPSLRNLVFTAPYMHDGRFQTIDEVLNFYNDSIKSSATTSPNLKNSSSGGMHLNLQDLADLKAFLLTLTDSTFVNSH